MENKGIMLHTKICLMNSLVLSIARYQPETWTLRKAERSKIKVFEMKMWRKVLGISQIDHRTNG